jgi:hypothetical protein
MAADDGAEARQSMRTTPQPPREMRRAGGVEHAESCEGWEEKRMEEKKTWAEVTLTARSSASRLHLLSSPCNSGFPSLAFAVVAGPTVSPCPPPWFKNPRSDGGRTEKIAGNVEMQRPGRLTLTQVSGVDVCSPDAGSSQIVLPAHAESRMGCKGGTMRHKIFSVTRHTTNATIQVTCTSATLTE